MYLLTRLVSCSLHGIMECWNTGIMVKAHIFKNNRPDPSLVLPDELNPIAARIAAIG
jgi:hypothetical protein